MQSHYTTATTVDFVEAGGVAPSSRAYHARALLLSYTSVGQGGWICPSGLRFPKPALIYPSSTLRVLPSGIEPAFPGLQPGAITRSATGAFCRPDWRPARRILGYSIVKELQTSWFGDEESNLDRQGQSLPACHWPIPEHGVFWWERQDSNLRMGHGPD